RAVKAADDVTDNASALKAFTSDWPSYYHLAPGRSNAIRALELPRDIKIIELGAGCGAVTRYLGEQHQTVHSLEGSPRRAAICRERCRNLPNVNVYVADFSNLIPEPEYDVVLLNGVLEYAPSFFKENIATDPVNALVQFAKSLLKPGGIVVI